MSRWISGQAIAERWDIEPFELFEHIKKGLQPYSGHGKRIIDSETLPRKRRYTLEEMKGHVRAKSVAGSVLGSGSFGRRPVTESEIEWISQRAYDDQPLEIVDPPADCVIMSLSLPVNEARAAEAIQQAMRFRFKITDVLSYEAQHDIHPIVTTTNEPDNRLEKITTKNDEGQITVETLGISVPMSADSRKVQSDPEEFVRSLVMSYENDNEIKIKAVAGKYKAYSSKDMGFKETSKPWRELINIIKDKDHLFFVGVAHGGERLRDKQYDRDRGRLREISKKLASFLNKTYNAQLQENFYMFELAKDKRAGTYKPKFTISIVEAENSYDTLSKDDLLREIRKMSARYSRLYTKEEVDSGRIAEKVKEELYLSISVAGKKKWITPNQARSFLNPNRENTLLSEDDD